MLAVLPACQSGTPASGGPAAESAAPGPVRWDMQSVVPGTQPLIGPHALRFTQEIAARSAGEIEIRFVEPAGFVQIVESLDDMSKGKFDAWFLSPAYLRWKDTAFEIFAGLPFGLPPRDHYAWLRAGGGLELHDELYAKAKLKAVPCVMSGPYGFGWFRTPVTTPDDLKGLDMLFAGRFGTRVMRRLGVATVSAPAGMASELFAGVRAGSLPPGVTVEGFGRNDIYRIDAAALSLPYVDVRFELHGLARNYYYPSFYRPFTMWEVVFGLDRWNGLSTARRRLIADVCHENILASLAADERLAAAALAEIRARGVKVREVPPAIREAARRAWEEVAAEESRKSADFRRIHEAYQRYLPGRPGGQT